MKRMIKANQYSDTKLVDLKAKTIEGEWVTLFENIPEDQASAIWKAGFRTGQNIFSIEDETSKRIMEMNRKTLGI